MSDDLIHTPLNSGADNEGLAILRRCLAKLSFAGQGLDTELDRQLESLRGAIRREANPDELLDEIELITRTLMRMEESSHTPPPLPPDYTGFVDQLSELAGQKFGAPLQALKQQLGENRAENHASLAAAAVARLLAQDASPAPGLLARLFGSRSGNDGAAAPSAMPAAQPSNAALLAPLKRLLGELSLPEEFGARLTELQQRLQPGLPVAELPDVIDSIANLVLDAASDDQTRFEAFLQALNERLEHVQRFLAQSTVAQTQDAEACATLSRDVDTEVRGMRDSLGQELELEDLKHRVQAHLDAISTSVTSYKSVQDERRAAMQTQIRQLEQQLASVESEANSLRQTLVEQRHRALTDPLTGLPNRTAYLERLEQEYARLRRYNSQLSLAIMDVDHFKRINDQHGHITGDLVLKAIAKLLQASVRKSDFVARFGGEEFVLLLPEVGLTDATKAINKLRQQIQARMLEAKGISVNVTASFGVADFREADTAADVFGRADRALYRAKERGRNQVCCELPRDGGDAGTTGS